MKIPLKFECSACHKVLTYQLNLDQYNFPYKCSCGYEATAVLSGFSIADRILLRATNEFHLHKDFSMTIVLSAMAFECQLAQLFRKWKRDELFTANFTWDDDNIEDELRRLSKVNTRIETVANMLTVGGLAGFISKDIRIQEVLQTDFPTLSALTLPLDFQRHLFWPRNRILHGGYAGSKEVDALVCLKLAAFGVDLFNTMDSTRSADS